MPTNLVDQLTFNGGYPCPETIQKLYEQLDVQRATQAYLHFIPTMSMQALLNAHPRDYGVSEAGGLIVYTDPGEGKTQAIERDGARLLDARTLFHYTAIVVTPAMEIQRVGVGSQYLATYKDSEGHHLDGSKNYTLKLPKGIPVKDFWSVTVYDAETRSLLQNGNPKPSISTFDQPDENRDSSIDIHFGPQAPAGKDKNWIKTIPGKGWFIQFRFYGPICPFFDQTWKPGDVTKT